VSTFNFSLLLTVGGSSAAPARPAKHVVTAAACLAAVLILTVGAPSVNAGQAYSNTGLGSMDDYSKTNQDLSGAFEFPWLGIEVRDGTGTFKPLSLRWSRGRFSFPWPCRSSSWSARRTASGSSGSDNRSIDGVAVFSAGHTGVAVIGSSGIGTSQELIIAVDGERTRDIAEFEITLNQADPAKWCI
jgi:hypothetical protein